MNREGGGGGLFFFAFWKWEWIRQRNKKEILLDLNCFIKKFYGVNQFFTECDWWKAVLGKKKRKVD